MASLRVTQPTRQYGSAGGHGASESEELKQLSGFPAVSQKEEDVAPRERWSEINKRSFKKGFSVTAC